MKESILFLNNQEIKDLGGEDMQAVLHDCQRAYVLMEEGDVLAPTKCVMRWGKTPEDENVLGRINAMPGYIGGEYNMAGIKWIGSGPMNYKKGLPRRYTIPALPSIRRSFSPGRSATRWKNTSLKTLTPASMTFSTARSA